MIITNGGEPGGQPPQGPQLGVLVQYTKDLSFENPNAPNSLMQQQPKQPALSVNINVAPKQLTNTDYEVELVLDGKAQIDATVLFSFELTYAGVFRLQNIPPENVAPLVMIECPRLLFPFAREIIAAAISGGGFPPLLLGAVDFAALYQQKSQEAQQQVTPVAR